MYHHKWDFGSLGSNDINVEQLGEQPVEKQLYQSKAEDIRPIFSATDNGPLSVAAQENLISKNQNILRNENDNFYNEEIIQKITEELQNLDLCNNELPRNFINEKNELHVKHNNKEKVRILCQNVKSINDSYKKEYFKNILSKKKVDILILTETWEEPGKPYGIERTFPNCKTIKSCGKKDSYKGKGIAVVIQYPLAQHVFSFKSIAGRLIRIVFKYRKKHAISLYAIQAPTAPYGAGSEETCQINDQIRQFLNEDMSERRRVVFCGDLNSYADRTLDYTGSTNGQSPSRIILSLQSFGLLDIYRTLNPELIATTFRSSTVASRLDQFWVSPQLFSQIGEAKIWPFEETISDHSAIFLELTWNHKKQKSKKFEKTIWNNKNEEKLSKWSELAEEFCKQKLSNIFPLEERAFRKKHSWLAKEFKKIARKVFWVKKRGKRNEKPPIWLYVMRKLRKAECLNNNISRRKFDKILKKYFPEIDHFDSFSNIRTQLKSAAQKLLQKKVSQKISTAIETRFNAFSSDISRHLDNILDRKLERIDTSFIKKGEEIICEPELVKTEFFDYYKRLFGSQRIPEISDLDEWNSTVKIAYDVDVAELKYVLSRTANNKAPGISGLLMEMIKYGGLKLLEWIVVQFNYWMREQKIPKGILKSQIWLIPKGAYTGDISNTRPINLIEALRKLFSSVMSNRINIAIQKYNFLKGWNFGFMAGRSTADAVKILQLVTEDAKVHHKPIVVMFLDIKKAYDSVHPLSIMNSLRFLNFDEKYWNILSSTFVGRKMRVLTQTGSTEFFHPLTGLEQGDPSSPILWNIFYEPLLQKLHALKGYQLENLNVSYLAYADDLTLIASNDNDMQLLLDTVTEYLSFHCMQIQPKKSIVVSSYPGKEFQLSQNNVSESISRSSKRDVITYLGVPFSLLKNKNIGLNVIQEIDQQVIKMKNKRISSSICAYVINSVLIPLASYRFIGQFQSASTYRKLENIFCSAMKKNLGLPRSYPHALLQSTILPIGIRNAYDVHVEQEIGNLIYWLNSSSPTSGILKTVIQAMQKCHPVWSGSRYQVQSKYINDLWNILEQHQLECISMDSIHLFKKGIFTCQYYNQVPHEEQAAILSKYNIQEIQNLMRTTRGNLKFKPFESIARKKDIELGLEPHAVIQQLYQNEERIIEILTTGISHRYKEILELQHEVEHQCPEIPYGEQDFDTVFTDGSFDSVNQKAGIAAICIRQNTKEIIRISRHVSFCESSTEAEIQAIFLGLVIMAKYSRVRTIKTDSQAAISAIERRNEGRKLINENFRFWLTEIRKRIYCLNGCKIEWIKGHSNIIGNELADIEAKRSLLNERMHEEIISEANKDVYYLWSRNRKIDMNARIFMKEFNQEKRNSELMNKSRRFDEIVSNLEQSELDHWFSVMKVTKSSLNSSFEREKMIKFIMKTVGNILPTADHLKEWKLTDENKCPNCQEIETREHVLKAVCHQDSLQQHINSVFGNLSASIFSNWSEQQMILVELKRTWNFHKAIGIIGKEMLELMKHMNYDSQRILQFGKKCLKIGYLLWKERCKERMSLFRIDA